ncbi:MAG: hydroxymethylpyrimidine/phosphomethylpyrimidine kinase [Myxococcales bacterium]
MTHPPKPVGLEPEPVGRHPELVEGQATPRVLVFAGLDSSGRAGLLADGQAVLASGARPVLCATAIAAQSSSRLVRMEPVSAAAVQAQAQAALEDGPIAAVKVGMVGSKEIHRTLLALFEGPLARAAIVVDPVFQTSRGGALFDGTAAEWSPLMAPATLVTPNLAEAAALTGLPCAGEAQMAEAARRLVALGARAVLLKGGHLEGNPADLLWASGAPSWMRGERIPGARRGTGCRLASAIAARLALGARLEEAVPQGVEWLRSWMRSGGG